MSKCPGGAPALILALVFFTSALTAGNVGGVVTGTDGGPLPAVTLTLAPTGDGQSRVAVTTTNGNYVFRSLPPGRYTLKAELQGHETRSREITVQQDRHSVPANFVLSAAQLDERITVTGVLDSFGNVTSPTTPLSEGQTFLTLFGAFPFESLVVNSPLSDILESVVVRLDNGQSLYGADIYYGAPNQMAVRTPPEVKRDSPWTIQVCKGVDCSLPYRLSIGRHAPYVAAISGNGIGDAAAQDGAFNLATFLNPLTDVGVFWINGTPEPGALGNVFLNGQKQQTLHYGASGLDALTQLNILIDPSTPSGHVTGFVEELFPDGSRRLSQPFTTWVRTGPALEDLFLGELAARVYGAGGLNMAEGMFRQIHRVRLDEAGEIIADAKLFTADVNLLNLNSQTYNMVTPGNPQFSIIPFGYQDPRQDLPFLGTALIDIPGFTRFTMATSNNPTLFQAFADPADRTFQGPVTISLTGTVDGTPSNLELTGTYQRQTQAFNVLEDHFQSSLDALLGGTFPQTLTNLLHTAEAAMTGDDEGLFFLGNILNCDQFGSLRSDLSLRREQVREMNPLERRLLHYSRTYDDLVEQAVSSLASCTTDYFWGFRSWDASPAVVPFALGHLGFEASWFVEAPRPASGGN